MGAGTGGSGGDWFYELVWGPTLRRRLEERIEALERSAKRKKPVRKKREGK